MKLKTFRGKLTAIDQEEDITEIRLSTNNGLMGYTVKKFAVIGPDASENIEGVVKVFTIKPSGTPNQNINFDDPTLLAVATISQSSTDQTNPNDQLVIFDSMVFNQDIYIYNVGGDYTASLNYYLELEQVKLNSDEATVATLKDMRGRE